MDKSKDRSGRDPVLTAAILTAPPVHQEASRALLYDVLHRGFPAKATALERLCARGCAATLDNLAAKNIDAGWLDHFIRNNPRGLETIALGQDIKRWTQRHHFVANWFIQDAAAAALASHVHGEAFMLRPIRRPRPTFRTHETFASATGPTDGIMVSMRRYRAVDNDGSELSLFTTDVVVRCDGDEIVWNSQAAGRRQVVAMLSERWHLSPRRTKTLAAALRDAECQLRDLGCRASGLRQKRYLTNAVGDLGDAERDFYWLWLRHLENRTPDAIASQEGVAKLSVVKKALKRAEVSIGLTPLWTPGAPRGKPHKKRKA